MRNCDVLGSSSTLWFTPACCSTVYCGQPQYFRTLTKTTLYASSSLLRRQRVKTSHDAKKSRRSKVDSLLRRDKNSTDHGIREGREAESKSIDIMISISTSAKEGLSIRFYSPPAIILPSTLISTHAWLFVITQTRLS
jgi:hypothetical protein